MSGLPPTLETRLRLVSTCCCSRLTMMTTGLDKDNRRHQPLTSDTGAPATSPSVSQLSLFIIFVMIFSLPPVVLGLYFLLCLTLLPETGTPCVPVSLSHWLWSTAVYGWLNHGFTPPYCVQVKSVWLTVTELNSHDDRPELERLVQTLKIDTDSQRTTQQYHIQYQGTTGREGSAAVGLTGCLWKSLSGRWNVMKINKINQVWSRSVPDGQPLNANCLHFCGDLSVPSALCLFFHLGIRNHYSYS